MSRKEIILKPGDKVLFSQLRAMGDTLLTTPAIRAFKLKHPEVEVDFLTEPLPAQILINNPRIRKVHIAVGKGSSLGDYLQQFFSLRKEKYKLYVDFLSIPRSAIIGFLTGAKHRIGYDLRGRSWAYTAPVERRREIFYNPLTKFDLLKTFNLSEDQLIPEIFPDVDDYQWADPFVTSLREMNYSCIIALAPWSKREWRRLSPEGWLKIIQRFSDKENIGWVLFGSPNEHSILTYLEEHFPQNVIWAGAPDLMKLAALMKRCHMYIGADNGLKHIAVATGIPTITVYTACKGVAPEAWNPPGSVKDSFLIVDSSLDNLNSSVNAIEDAYLSLMRK